VGKDTKGTTIRKVKLQQTTGDYIQIYELEVYDVTGTNVAKGKRATSSSQYREWGDPKRAVDGDLGTLFHSYSRSEGGDQNPWLNIDLGQSYEATQIVIYNRDDALSERLSYANILLYDSSNTLIDTIKIGNTRDQYKLKYDLTRSATEDAGYVDIFVDSGNGYKMETIANRAWKRNDVALEKCFDALKGVQVKGPNDNG
jgi:hypothetical protein